MQNKNDIIPPHGGFRNLKAYQMSEIVYDYTAAFCDKYISRFSRTHDQMVQAARSGKQNIREGSQVSGTSKKTELKLVGVARASLEELLADYEDFLRQKKLKQWNKNSKEANQVRALAFTENRSYMTYSTYLNNGENAANCAICIVHQTNYLLDCLLKQLENDFVQHGGFTERLYNARRNRRQF